jgi:F-type H+-transporting ATPase subunit epsilon
MARKSFACRLITPEAKVFDQPAVSAVIPAWDGSMGILANRAPLVAKLGIGELRLAPEAGGGEQSFYVEGGFVRMAANTLTILAAKAVPAADLSETDAQAELAEAEARRPSSEGDRAQLERIRSERQRARQKLRVARSLRARR